MKKSLLHAFFLLVGFSLLSSTCGKKDDEPAPGPDMTYVTEGVLCTMGISHDNKFDTLQYYTGNYNVKEYVSGTATKKDEVFIVVNSNNSVSVKLKEPLISGGRSYLYFKCKPSPNISQALPGYQYYFSFSEAPSSETEFVLARNNSDKTKFTLESRNAPGQFLGTRNQVWATSNSTLEADMVFSSKKQEFFFLPK